MKIGGTAIFSDCRKYRYYLVRWWDDTKPRVMFIGLNPSTANETENDATIRRVIGFAKSWGYGGVYMCNLFTFVSTNPNALIRTPENAEITDDSVLKRLAKEVDKVIFAWGCFKQHKKRMNEVIKMFPDAYCLKKSKEGYPCHPLYLKSDLIPIKFNG